MVLAGEAEVADLTVAGASHYVAWPGIISANCGFDELTHFTETQYRYLFSRLDRPSDGPLSQVPLRMRAASNPGGPGHDWVKRRFIDRQVNADDPLDTPEQAARRIFIPARVLDNPSIDRDAYVRSLGHLEPEVRAQLLDGDWDARQPGAWYFDDRDLAAAMALGREYEDRLALLGPEEAPDFVADGLKHLGIDWGDHSHGLLGLRLEAGGWFIAREFVGEASEPGESTRRMLGMGAEFDLPWGRAYFDAAGKSSQLTFNATAEKLIGGARPRAKAVPFGAKAPQTASSARRSVKGTAAMYLRRLARRSADGSGVQVLAISPRCPVLLRQLKALERDPESITGAWLKDDDQHGPDAAVALVSGTAVRNRSPQGAAV